MIRNRFLLKFFSVFFLLEILSTTIAPTLSWALTAGPTSPEAWSFEPFDSTDMVDLKTGDFVYNLPLLEVPGPAGSYPLSLSYHAGIQPDQEASWVGLGWTLNPGSIARLVNGYPDDHNNVTGVNRSYFKGGKTTQTTVGLSLGYANCATVSFGLTFAQDTYKGSGVGGYIGAGVGLYDGAGSIDASINISPYGGASYSAGVGISGGFLMLGGSASLSYNSASGLAVGAGAGVNVSTGDFGNGGTSLLGASMSSSNGSKLSLSVAGATQGIYNSKANSVSTHVKGFDVDVPVWYGISVRLGRSTTRYWIDETSSAHTFGSLYSYDVIPGDNDYVAFDTYDLLDSNIDRTEFNDAERVLGGSLPDFDSYTVTGQGIGGSIRPYAFKQHLYRQNNYAKNIHAYTLNSEFHQPLEFRFVNDFSNRYEYNPESFAVNGSRLTYNFDGAVTTGYGNESGYNPARNFLAGSRHIEWYANREIASGEAKNVGFVDCSSRDFTRDAVDFSADQVGGFSITNSSGVTYHYALPVYSYEETMMTLNTATKKMPTGTRSSKLTKPTKYAYTWLLTAVTGADFVDRNRNGLADSGDFGYWVNFDYKLWLSDYRWRNPGVGTIKDLDGEFESYAAGKKEIYYLDKIITPTHVAVFEISKRIDGREVVDQELGGFDPPLLEDSQVPDLSKVRSSAKLDRIKLYQYESFSPGLLDKSKIIRQIDFNYDDVNALAPGTPNSFEDNDPAAKKGKLTLKSISFLGKNGSNLIPPMSFVYGKNPSYKKDYVDVWGYYKSDFSEEYLASTNEIVGRQTTEVSAEDVDAWSLSQINTSVGAQIKIDYESDRYQEVEVETNPVLPIDDVIDQGNEIMKVTFTQAGLKLSDYFTEDQVVDIDVVGGLKGNASDGSNCKLGYHDSDAYYAFVASGDAKVVSINDDEHFITVQSASHPHFYNTLYNDPKRWYLEYQCYYSFDKNSKNTRPSIILGGFVSYDKQKARTDRPGGGLRVVSIGLENKKGNMSAGDGRVISYKYDNGKTAYEPFQMVAPVAKTVDKKVYIEDIKNNERYADEEEGINPKLSDYLKKIANRHYHKIMSLARLIPGPGVMYQNVSVSEKNVSAIPNASTGQNTITIPLYSKYEFETFSINMLDVQQTSAVPVSVPGIDYTIHNNAIIKDYTSRVGNLKSIVLYDNNNTPDNSDDDIAISSTKNTYLHEDTNVPYEINLQQKFSNQGFLAEAYTRARTVKFHAWELKPYPENGMPPKTSMHEITKDNINDYVFDDDHTHLLATLSQIQSFPSVATGQVNENFKTGIKSETKNIAFDFFSGETLQALSTDSYGNNFLSVAVPAYTHYPAMGLKINDQQNRHMLTQVAENYSFSVDDALRPQGVLSASIQTWSNSVLVLDEISQSAIWRPQYSYAWNGNEPLGTDGSYPFEDFNVQSNHFNFSDPDLNVNWQKTGEITLYDPYSHGLEARDINNNPVATRMNYNHTLVVASAVNSSYNDFGVSSAEYYSGNTEKDGGIDRGSGFPSITHAHTGQYSLLVMPGKTGFDFKIKPSEKKYRASVWVYATGDAETEAELAKIELLYTINGKQIGSVHPVLQKSKSKSWYLMNLDIPSGTNDVTVTVKNNSPRGVYFDDFRVHPYNAGVTSYVYDPFSGELAYTLDTNNFYTKFEYDEMGRLIRTSKELLNFDFGPGKESFRADAILKEIKYNYGTGN